MICSIIVVSKNNLEDVKYTLDSLLHDDFFSSCEVIVIDDSDNDAIKNYVLGIGSSCNFVYLSGDGVSLYSAMNLGIENAQGDYIWFLNSGDRRAKEFSLDLLSKLDGDIVVGNTRYQKNNIVQYEVETIAFNLSEKNQLNNTLPCHQSMLFRRVFLHKFNIRYDLTIPVSADYDFIKSTVAKKAIIKYFPVVISEFTLGGISTKYQNFKQLLLHAEGLRMTRGLTFWQHKILIIKLLRKLSLRFY